MRKMTEKELEKTRKTFLELLETMVDDCHTMPEEDWVGDREFYLLYGRLGQLHDLKYIDSGKYEELRDRVGTIQSVARDRCSCNHDIQAFMERLMLSIETEGEE